MTLIQKVSGTDKRIKTDPVLIDAASLSLGLTSETDGSSEMGIFRVILVGKGAWSSEKYNAYFKHFVCCI